MRNIQLHVIMLSVAVMLSINIFLKQISHKSSKFNIR